MQKYGYLWEGMFPLRSEKAKELFNENLEIFCIYNDNTEGAIIDFEDLQEHAKNGGLFGIEKELWQSFISRRK